MAKIQTRCVECNAKITIESSEIKQEIKRYSDEERQKFKLNKKKFIKQLLKEKPKYILGFPFLTTEQQRLIDTIQDFELIDSKKQYWKCPICKHKNFHFDYWEGQQSLSQWENYLSF